MIHPRDCDEGCEGDPLCEYTDLARLHFRNESLAAMRRLEKKMRDMQMPLARDMSTRCEELFELVCAAIGQEPSEPVEGCGWTREGYEVLP